MKACLVSALALAAMGASVTYGDEYRYERLSPEQLGQAIERHPVAFIPVGICEWHGEQSACGLDALKAETLCRMAARQLGGVCFPTLWAGPDGSTPFEPTQYPRGTLTLDRKLYDETAEELLTKIEAMGFRVAVYLSGHYPGVILKVAERFNRRGRMQVISISENLVVHGFMAGDHAATWETSMLMVLRPGLVDLTRLPPLSPTTRPAGEVIPPSWHFTQQNEYYGVYGSDPRVWANCFFGRKGTEAVLDGLAREVGKALADASYGKDRPETEYPSDERQQPEVRYDFQLPRDWMQRFHEKPVVYWPVTASESSIEEATQRAIGLAREAGGMVFPAFAYAPGKDESRAAISAVTFGRIVAQVASALADMDFHVVAIVPGESLSNAAGEQLRQVKPPDDQARVLVVETGSSESVPAPLSNAIDEMVAPASASSLALESPWRINGGHAIPSLTGALYAALGETRTYDHAFELSDAQARQNAWLELGGVRNHCEVILNDAPPMLDHWPPYRLIVTGKLKPGRNTLKVVVRHKLQPMLDAFFYRPGPPEMLGPVTLRLWEGGHH